MSATEARRVLVLDPQDFSRLAYTEYLTRSGHDVAAMATVEAAAENVPDFAPEVVVVHMEVLADPSTAMFLARLHAERPETGIVVITRHEGAGALVDHSGLLPEVAVVLSRTNLSSMSDVADAVQRSMDRAAAALAHAGLVSTVSITTQQAEVLSLIAEGYSNVGIARMRGVSVRTAEGLVQRTIGALGIESDHRYNPRVLAVRMWHQGRVFVR